MQIEVTTTTPKYRLLNALQRLVFTCAFLVFAISMVAQEVGKQPGVHPSEIRVTANEGAGGLGTFQFQIHEVRNRADAKLFNEQARGLFDCVPAYNERTNSFSFKARFVFDTRDILEKLAHLGFTPVYFKEVKNGE